MDDTSNILTLPRSSPTSDVRQLVTTIHSSAELDEQLEKAGSNLTVLMCKARSCRPCKMFGRKYSRIAESYPMTSFLEVIGDESADTRKMMIERQVKVTPTFMLFRNNELVHTVSGINDSNLRAAVDEH